MREGKYHFNTGFETLYCVNLLLTGKGCKKVQKSRKFLCDHALVILLMPVIYIYARIIVVMVVEFHGELSNTQ